MSPRTRRIVSIAVPVVIALVVAIASRSGGDGAASPASGSTVPVVVDSIAAIDLTPTTAEEPSDAVVEGSSAAPSTRVADEAEPAMGLAGWSCVTAADDSIAVDELPDEAIETLELIAADGPFPYRQDGATFQNREGELPDEDQGYYREYTVETPGSDDRGARRIVTGECGEGWYTDDHYDSFALIETP